MATRRKKRLRLTEGGSLLPHGLSWVSWTRGRVFALQHAEGMRLGRGTLLSISVSGAGPLGEGRHAGSDLGLMGRAWPSDQKTPTWNQLHMSEHA